MSDVFMKDELDVFNVEACLNFMFSLQKIENGLKPVVI